MGKKPITLYYSGHEICEPGHFYGPAIRAHYLMHFVLHGKGIYKVGERKYPLQKGDVFLIRPQEVTYYVADEHEPWEYAWIAFDGEEAEALLKEWNLYFVLTGQIDEIEEVSGYLAQSREIFQMSGYEECKLLGNFYFIMSCIKRHVNVANVLNGKGYLEKAKEYIRHHYSYPIHVQEIARFVGLERSYLYKLFMLYEHKSPKQYLTEYRILAAKELIANSNYNLTEIGLSCGFADSPSFSKIFKKLVGISPRQYRKQEK